MKELKTLSYELIMAHPSYKNILQQGILKALENVDWDIISIGLTESGIFDGVVSQVLEELQASMERKYVPPKQQEDPAMQELR